MTDEKMEHYRMRFEDGLVLKKWRHFCLNPKVDRAMESLARRLAHLFDRIGLMEPEKSKVPLRQQFDNNK